jgi:ubiquinone/menaquinone biosynthesis C-methylase UbiE
VTFQHGDVRNLSLRDEACDAVITQWFLDCFTPVETAAIVRTLAPVVRPGGIWLFADFAIPERGLSRLAARLVTSGLYGFFRGTTGMSARALPPSEREIRRNGFAPLTEASFLGGMLRSVVFRKTGTVCDREQTDHRIA